MHRERLVITAGAIATTLGWWFIATGGKGTLLDEGTFLPTILTSTIIIIYALHYLGLVDLDKEPVENQTSLSDILLITSALAGMGLLACFIFFAFLLIIKVIGIVLDFL